MANGDREGMPHAHLRWTLVAAATAAVLTAVPASAGAARLIAPLDVRVVAEVRPGSVLNGSWHAYSTEEGGRWIGANLKLQETWKRGAARPLRVRGKAGGGPSHVHYAKVSYLKRRVGEGVLTEERPDGDTAPPVVLQCSASGSDGPGQPITTSAEAAMQIVDQPARNRVVVRGPGIAFFGPQCRPPGQELPVRGVGVHPPDGKRPWIPRGAQTPWEFTVPRAEFAAGGTFRFRGSYSFAFPIEQFTTGDVFGTALTTGKVAIDLKVRRIGA